MKSPFQRGRINDVFWPHFLRKRDVLKLYTYQLLCELLKQKANPVYIFGDFGDPKIFGVKNYRYSLNCCAKVDLHFYATLARRKINMLHNSLTFIKIKLQNFGEEKKMRK